MYKYYFTFSGHLTNRISKFGYIVDEYQYFSNAKTDFNNLIETVNFFLLFNNERKIMGIFFRE